MGIWDSGFGFRDSAFGARDLESWILNLEFEIYDPPKAVRDFEFWIPRALREP